MKTAEAYLIYREELAQRTVWDYFRVQSTLLEPLHQYKGKIILSDSLFEFRGKARQDGADHYLLFHQSQLRQVFLGFDQHYKIIEDRSFGFTFQPLRLEVRNGNHDFVLYLVLDFQAFMRTSDNKQWLDKLEEWRR